MPKNRFDAVEGNKHSKNVASQDTPASVIAEVCETRIAMAFFGGVSLAVYESGVAVEFFRLVAGDGVYQKLRE